MADRKISDLTALTTPASGDFLPIVDISEAAAASKNKRITIEELMRGVPNGTAAAPGIAFETDPNTGIYSPGADQLAVATNGTGRLFINSNGSITAPQGTFTLGTSGAANAIINSADGIFLNIDSDNTTTGEVFVVGKDRTGASGGSELFRITEAGLVGIGISSPDNSLHVVGGIKAQQTTGAIRVYNPNTSGTNAPEIQFSQNTPSGEVTVGYIQFTPVDRGGASYYSDLSLGTTTRANEAVKLATLEARNRGDVNSYIKLNVDGTNAVHIDGSRRVGIGTSSPGAIIHSTPAAVNGGLATAFLATQAGAGVNTGTALRFGWGSSNGSFSEISAALQATGVGTNLDLKTSTDNSTAASTKVRITSAGLVGIGTTAPRARIDAQTGSDTTVGIFGEPLSFGQNQTDTTIHLTGNHDDGSGPSITFSEQNVTNLGTTTRGARIQSIRNGRAIDRQMFLRLSPAAADGTTTKGLEVQRNVITFDTAASERARIDSSGRLLIGTSTAPGTFPSGYTPQITASKANDGGIASLMYVGGNIPSKLFLGKSNTTSIGSHVIVADGNNIGEVDWVGSDGSKFVSAARISAFVDGTPGADDMPGRIVLSTTAVGASSPTERMRIKSAGTINFSNVSTYADNTAALAGGLVAGDVYRKSDGTLMITY